MIQLLFLLLGVVFPPSHQSTCDSSTVDHTLIVSDTGNDTVDCLTGRVPCHTLEYVLQYDKLNNTMVSLNYSTQNIHVSEPIHIYRKSGLVILGIFPDQQVLLCDFGAGIAFEDVQNVCIENITFQGCSILHKTTAFNPSVNETFPSVSSALFFYHSKSMTVLGCTFTSDRGSGISMYDVGGENLIKDSLFFNNTLVFSCPSDDCYNKSVGIYIEKTYCGNFTICDTPVPPNDYTSYSSYHIENCTFNLNNNTVSPELTRTEAILSYKEHRTLAHGGGFGIRLTGKAAFNFFEVKSCNFINNRALWGGGMEVGIGDDSSSNVVRVSESWFTLNHALTGGGLRFGFFPGTDYSGYGTEEMNNTYSVTDCLFSSNMAQSAGAFSYISSRQVTYTKGDSHLCISHTNFTGNNANISGAAIGISAWNNEIAGYPTSVEITDCLFENNHITMEIDNTKNFGLGAIFTEDIPLFLYGTNTFIHNRGSALVISSTTVYMSGNVLFQENHGINGGAIHLMGMAWITLSPNLKLTFERNSAFLLGGAIFSAYSIPHPIKDSRYCIIRFENESLLPLDQNITVSFLYNTALESGQAIYLSTPGGCFIDSRSSLPFMDESIYHYESTDQNKTLITTPPGRIEFGSPAKNEGGVYTTQVVLGHSFEINPISHDVFSQLTQGSAIVSMICVHCNTSDAGYDLRFNMVGQKLLDLNNTAIITPFQVVGPQDSDQDNDTLLILLTNTIPSAVGYLHLNITSCPLGYVYSEETQKCECFLSENLYCGVERNVTCIKYGYWFGPAHNSSISANCPNGLCDYSNGNCPTKPCSDVFRSFCKLPERDSDDLCASNRGGILCSSCRQGFQFTFSALRCVPDTSCNAGSTILLIFMMILFWVVLVLILLTVLKLNLRLGSGHLYCLIYYFGVLPNLTTNSYPFLEIVQYTFGGFIRVEPHFIGLIDKCFAYGLNNVQHYVLRYVHPLFISIVILVIIGITRCWPRFSTISKQNYGVRALCVLLYISFTSLTETSLSVLNFATFQNVPGVYVNIEPTIPYFDPSGHFPYALLAISIQAFIVLPFLSIMLFSQCLARIPRINLTRIKPILDEYQACYKTEFRWFAGYYLACRQFVFIFSLINFGKFGGIFFLQILSCLVLVIHTTFQPYRKRWLNVLDTILLADLAIYSLFNGSTANVVLEDSEITRALIVHVLVLTPVVYFLGLCAFKLTAMLYYYCKGKGSYITSTSLGTSTQSKLLSSPLAGPAGNKPKFADLEREPLIFSEGNISSYTDPEPESDVSGSVTSSDLNSTTSMFKRFTQRRKKISTASTQMKPKLKSINNELEDSIGVDVRATGKYTVSVVNFLDSQEN